MRTRTLATWALLIFLIQLCHAQTRPAAHTMGNGVRAANASPNILFIIMDDVGIDQMKVFGYGGLGLSAPATPNIDTIARAGVRFRNTWSMPECSPSRVIFFEGRYPLRTNIYNAILSTDLANSQLSPYEVTTPELLKTVGYTSALFGKFHLGGPNYNPYGMTTPHAAGFDYFDGFLEGAPYPIDTGIGGQFSAPGNHPYSCGFIPNSDTPGGADTGACHFANNSCTVISRDATHPTPGRTCLEEGGLFVPKKGCDVAVDLNFANQTNAYYVWKRIINYADGSYYQYQLTDPSARTYVSEVTAQSAVDWINQQNASHQPWMATVSFANIHSPYQQPPSRLLPAWEKDTSGLQCTGNQPQNQAALRLLSNQMLEAMDTEIGRVMVETGLASYNPDGSLNYQPERTNTMVVIIGDNGTYAPGVKFPFDPNLAKAWVYQTGVWVPLIVSGPLVVSPNRDVDAMVNIADLFQLWGEFVGIDVHGAVPHTIDSVSMLPYLINPQQAQIREVNFTQSQSNIHLNDQAPPPCVVQLSSPPTCAQLFTSQQLCNFEGGIWYGPPAQQQFQDCCAVKNSGIYDSTGLAFLPDTQMATRNSNYKLIQTTYPNCSTGHDDTFTEFYRINERPALPRIDYPGLALCATPGDPNNPNNKPACPTGLNPEETSNFNTLQSEMSAIVASQPPCPGDGNEDLLVNDLDLTDWQFFESFNGGGSSWYDFNHDAITNAIDGEVVQANQGRNCNPQSASKAPSRKP